MTGVKCCIGECVSVWCRCRRGGQNERWHCAECGDADICYACEPQLHSSTSAPAPAEESKGKGGDPKGKGGDPKGKGGDSKGKGGDPKGKGGDSKGAKGAGPGMSQTQRIARVLVTGGRGPELANWAAEVKGTEEVSEAAARATSIGVDASSGDAFFYTAVR